MDVEARKWRGMRYLGVVGRRAPGASSADVQAEVATVAERLARQHPRDHEQGRRLRAIALREDWFGGAGRTLQLLQVAVAFVLLIGCANVAHLQLARAAARRHELAVRTALGAGRGRLARQLLAESLTLAGAGGIGGLLIAKLGLGALASLVPDDVPQFSEVSITGRVLAWAAILVLATAAAAGAWPALAGSRQGGRPGRQVRGTLVVGQIALALPLLTGALLVARGLANVLSSDLAFEARGLLTARINVPVDRYAGAEARRALYEALEARLQALPGVQAATVAAGLPYANWGGSWKIAPVDEAPFFAGAGNVRGGYFATMGIPLRAGRTFDAADERSDSAHVGIVNETLARRLWPGESAIGRRLRFGHWPGELSVVGVVGDTRRLGRAAEPEAYMPLGGQPPQVFVAVRSARGEAVSATTLRSALHDVDATLPLTEVRTMEEAIGESLAQRRLALLVLGIFAVFALVLTAAGVYGVTSYVVIQRTRELATRAALGARPGQIVGLVLREAWSLSAIGLLLGIAAALGARRLLAAAVPEAASGDLMTYAAPPVAILVVALLAAYLPARRAARLDPMGALRHE
jgi:predicted permease